MYGKLVKEMAPRLPGLDKGAVQHGYPVPLDNLGHEVGRQIVLEELAMLWLANANPVKLSSDDTFAAGLRSGWNQVGNPSPYAVSVRDLRRKKTVLVRAGHSYLARASR